MGSGPVLGLRLGVCGCGQIVPWDSLRMSSVVYWQPVSENRFPYSRYHPNFWTCNAVARGRISDGPFLHEYDVRYDSENQPIEIDGSYSWSGNGVFRSSVAVDCSGTASFVVSCHVGPYQRDKNARLSVDLGIGNADLSEKILLRENVQLVAQEKIWAYVKTENILSPIDVGALFFFVTVRPVGQNSWFVDKLQLEFQGKTPGHYVATAGSPIVNDRPSRRMTMARTCPDCRKRIPKRIDTNVLVEEPIGPLPIDVQTEVI